MADSTAEERKQHIQKTFNTVADGYDSPALSFFSKSAAILPQIFRFRGDEHVLDVATGTGQAARALAPHLPRGHVVGIDFSEGMLAQARAHAARQNLRNTEFMFMDMQAMTFPARCFDAANCSFGIFFVEDMHTQLQHIAAQVKPGGTVVACSFYDTSFEPLSNLFFDTLEQYGIARPPLSWKRISTETQATALFARAGLSDVRVQRHDVGYFLRDERQWWDVIWYAGFRGLVNQLAPEALQRFKRQHLADIGKRATSEGLRLDTEIIFTQGRVLV